MCYVLQLEIFEFRTSCHLKCTRTHSYFCTFMRILVTNTETHIHWFPLHNCVWKSSDIVLLWHNLSSLSLCNIHKHTNNAKLATMIHIQVNAGQKINNRNTFCSLLLCFRRSFFKPFYWTHTPFELFNARMKICNGIAIIYTKYYTFEKVY